MKFKLFFLTLLMVIPSLISKVAFSCEIGNYNICQKEADQGLVDAQLKLGAMYIDKDFKKALKWTRKAAEQGNVKAQLNLGLMYGLDRRNAKDNKNALKWIRKAAEEGDADAQVILGEAYINKDDKQALKWVRKSVEQRNIEAQYILGWFYETGRVVTKDIKKGVKLYRMAAAKGNANAQYSLGLISFSDDKNESRKLMIKSAEQGMVRAQRSLGQLFFYKKNYARAVKWYRKAAEQGDSHSQMELGKMYLKGEGLLQDYILAHMWLNLSVRSNGFDFSGIKLRDALTKKMTPSQIEKAQKLAKRWRPKKKKYAKYFEKLIGD